MAKTDLTNQRQVYFEEYIRSGDNHYAGGAVPVSYTHLTLPTTPYV